MKTINIGDIHGRTIWKTIDPNLYDKIIFVGDYVDSFDVSDEQILNNLLDIIEFKKIYPDKIILLWGNHDLQYAFSHDRHGCSGYRPQMKDDLHRVFNEFLPLFQMAYQVENTIWTHAGVHEGWYNTEFYKFARDYQDLSLAEQLNLAFKKFSYDSLFNVGHRRGGYHNVGGPFWCDINELAVSPLREYNQIVGHNRVREIYKIYKYNREVVFIDTLESDNPKFYETEIKLKEDENT